MEKGKMYNIKISLKEISHTFKKGNRVRLAVTSSFYPWINTNPNTGLPIASDTSEPLVSRQTIHYGHLKHGFRSRISLNIL